jgi:hypothetical protein
MATQFYRKKLSILVGCITHRNQCDPVQSSSDPVDLEEELQALAGLMPPRWWQLPSQPLPGLKDSILEMHERMATQFCHYQAHIYLHLPLMLQSPVDARYENNRAKCLVASRQMIQIYAQLHEFAGGKITICRVIDLQAFTAAIIVILGHLGYGPSFWISVNSTKCRLTGP